MAGQIRAPYDEVTADPGGFWLSAGVVRAARSGARVPLTTAGTSAWSRPRGSDRRLRVGAGRNDRRATDGGAVAAAKILDGRLGRGDYDPGMAARDAGCVDPDGAARIAADDVLPGCQRERAIVPRQPGSIRASRPPSSTDGGVSLGSAHERIPDAMRRPDESRSCRVVSERPANLLDESPHARLRHRARPARSGSRSRPSDHRRATLEQQQQQVERLGREVSHLRALGELAGLRVQGEGSEPRSHAGPRRNLTVFSRSGRGSGP